MNIKNKKILVTGADGFIGSHLTETLVKMGCNVKAFVFYNSFNSWGWIDTFEKNIKDSLEIFAGDVRDPNGVRNAVKGCDIVFHLAALIAIPFSYHSPDSYVDTNIKGTLNILNACRNFSIGKLVHTSTSEVYGTAKYVPIDEAHPLQGQSPYSASKIGADQIAISFYNSFGLPVTICRPFNTFGPRQSARAVIPTIIIQIASGKKKIKLGSMHPTRDFNYVSDIVSGFIKIAESDKSAGEVINLGSNSEISIGETVKKIRAIMKSDIEVTFDEVRKRPDLSEVERLLADNTKAKILLGWKPEVTFEAGLNKTVKWVRKSENISRYKHEIYNI